MQKDKHFRTNPTSNTNRQASQKAKNFFDDDPLTLMLLQNPQNLLSNSLKAGALDVIKQKMQQKKVERAHILNELLNQKQEVEAII